MLTSAGAYFNFYFANIFTLRSSNEQYDRVFRRLIIITFKYILLQRESLRSQPCTSFGADTDTNNAGNNINPFFGGKRFVCAAAFCSYILFLLSKVCWFTISQ